MKLVKTKDILDLTSLIDVTIFSEELTFDRLIDVSQHVKKVIMDDKLPISPQPRKRTKKEIVKSSEGSGAPSNKTSPVKSRRHKNKKRTKQPDEVNFQEEFSPVNNNSEPVKNKATELQSEHKVEYGSEQEEESEDE